jgi:hypothetical protein
MQCWLVLSHQAAARLVHITCKFEHITPLLWDLHRLHVHVPERIKPLRFGFICSLTTAKMAWLFILGCQFSPGGGRSLNDGSDQQHQSFHGVSSNDWLSFIFGCSNMSIKCCGWLWHHRDQYHHHQHQIQSTQHSCRSILSFYFFLFHRPLPKLVYCKKILFSAQIQYFINRPPSFL